MTTRVTPHNRRTPTAATTGTLRVSGGAANLSITGTDRPGPLYHATFEGLVPVVAEANGVVTVRYRRRLHPLAFDRGEGSIELSALLPWRLQVDDAAAGITATLRDLTLTGLNFGGAVADTTLDLPRPVGTVTIHVQGRVRNLRLRRPAGVPIAVRIDGAACRLHIDGEELGAVGRGYQRAAPTGPHRYVLTAADAVDGLSVTH